MLSVVFEDADTLKKKKALSGIFLLTSRFV